MVVVIRTEHVRKDGISVVTPAASSSSRAPSVPKLPNLPTKPSRPNHVTRHDYHNVMAGPASDRCVAYAPHDSCAQRARRKQ
eukprot:144940-Prymnesium_polylepis.2